MIRATAISFKITAAVLVRSLMNNLALLGCFGGRDGDEITWSRILAVRRWWLWGRLWSRSA